MSRSQHLEELDALLDGDAVAVSEELAPLATVARALRAEVAAIELDPDVAARHIDQALGRRPATRAPEGPRVRRSRRPAVGVPDRPRARRSWRRQVVSLLLAAALLLVPAVLASAHALPGDPLYDVKRLVENVRLIVAARSPGSAADERLRIAATRLEELQALLRQHDTGPIPEAVTDLQAAVTAAQRAIADAQRQGASAVELADLLDRLDSIRNGQAAALQQVAAPAAAPATDQAAQVTVAGSRATAPMLAPPAQSVPAPAQAAPDATAQAAPDAAAQDAPDAAAQDAQDATTPDAQDAPAPADGNSSAALDPPTTPPPLTPTVGTPAPVTASCVTPAPVTPSCGTPAPVTPRRATSPPDTPRRVIAPPAAHPTGDATRQTRNGGGDSSRDRGGATGGTAGQDHGSATADDGVRNHADGHGGSGDNGGHGGSDGNSGHGGGNVASGGHAGHAGRTHDADP